MPTCMTLSLFTPHKPLIFLGLARLTYESGEAWSESSPQWVSTPDLKKSVDPGESEMDDSFHCANGFRNLTMLSADLELDRIGRAKHDLGFRWGFQTKGENGHKTKALVHKRKHFQPGKVGFNCNTVFWGS